MKQEKERMNKTKMRFLASRWNKHVDSRPIVTQTRRAIAKYKAQVELQVVRVSSRVPRHWNRFRVDCITHYFMLSE